MDLICISSSMYNCFAPCEDIFNFSYPPTALTFESQRSSVGAAPRLSGGVPTSNPSGRSSGFYLPLWHSVRCIKMSYMIYCLWFLLPVLAAAPNRSRFLAVICVTVNTIPFRDGLFSVVWVGFSWIAVVLKLELLCFELTLNLMCIMGLWRRSV